ncbi:MAG: TenA family protein, partial [Brachybacterium sp.]|nr:TenA family protein [Brachybacterium sp.]
MNRAPTADAIAPAGPLTERIWTDSAPIRERIDRLPLLRTLADGTLEPEVFVRYLEQDGHYLEDYRRALAMLAVRADDPDAASLWASSAAEAVGEEQQMQADVLADDALAALVTEGPPTLTTRAYGAFLLAATAYEPYPVGVAAVLPCYWVYAELGAVLAARADGVPDHRYAAWAAAYGDESFHTVARRAVAEMERIGSLQTPAMQERMRQVFLDATHFEERFWQAATDGEHWDSL